MIRLGMLVKDKVTDFEGKVIARAKYLYGCVWVCIVPKELHDEVPIEGVWLDEQRVEKIKKVEEQTKGETLMRMKPRGGHIPKTPKMNFPKG